MCRRFSKPARPDASSKVKILNPPETGPGEFMVRPGPNTIGSDKIRANLKISSGLTTFTYIRYVRVSSGIDFFMKCDFESPPEAHAVELTFFLDLQTHLLTLSTFFLP